MARYLRKPCSGNECGGGGSCVSGCDDPQDLLKRPFLGGCDGEGDGE